MRDDRRRSEPEDDANGKGPFSECAADGARGGDQATAPLVQALLEYAAQNPVRFHMPGHKGRAPAGAAAHPRASLPPAADTATGAGAAPRKGITSSEAGTSGSGGAAAGATDPEFARLLLAGGGAFAADVTEIDGLDDLHAPEGAIAAAQRLAAQAYGADETFFLVNGSTCGLHAAIMATCRPGDEIIVSRDTHRAIAGGLVLSGARPVYVAPEVDELYQIPLGPSPAAVKTALERHPGARAVVVTNPSYYGVAPDIKTLVATVHDYGKIAVVDEAHGAHLPFHEALPLSALEAGADAVVSGAHKSLPAMTQASFLHLNLRSGAVDPEAVRRALRLIETTSPSYVLMASLDAARRVAATRGRELLDRTIRAAAAARERLSGIPGVACLDADRLAARGFAHDPTKLLVSFAGLGSLGVTGVEVARLLRERHGVEVELADARNILAILTMADSWADVQALVEAIESVVAAFVKGTRRDHAAYGSDMPGDARRDGSPGGDGVPTGTRGDSGKAAAAGMATYTGSHAGLGGAEGGAGPEGAARTRHEATSPGDAAGAGAGAGAGDGAEHAGADRGPSPAAVCDVLKDVPPLRMTPREAALSGAEWVPLDEACGRVSADAIVPYPPGVPVVCPGEEITGALVEFLRDAVSSGQAARLRGVRRDGQVLAVAGH
ncbi:MAG: aminotransferase class I/II-fold pyridoxal phosphate-dependent enzyme [Bacillota bacterium]|nr:aminotransferase class I/II-fold pyridoxal phosphate-dependent enzyme [Bacillota bacterium]